MNKPLLNTIAIAAISVLVTIQVMQLFNRRQDRYEKLIRAEMKIEQLEEKRLSDSLLMVEQLKAKDLVIAALNDKDTVIIRNIKLSNERIKNIPATVPFDDAGLRAEAGRTLHGD